MLVLDKAKQNFDRSVEQMYNSLIQQKMWALLIQLVLFYYQKKKKQKQNEFISLIIFMRHRGFETSARATFQYEFPKISDDINQTYRINATGKACGSHNNAKFSLVFRTNILIFESDEKAGAFDPSGSI